MLGLTGDEAKGKITNSLAKGKRYNYVARWAGGNNAGHTVYVNGKKYVTHLIPSGIFYGIESIIGPGCVLHPQSFFEELEYLKQNGFDTSLVKVSSNCHIVQDEHIEFDKRNLAGKLGTTSKGIAPAYAAKAARTGILAKDVLNPDLIWKGEFKKGSRVLCEGAQGVWLDINHGTYPYVTSSDTLPYGACSLGIPTQKISTIYGAAKIYDTRSGEDPLFPETLFEDPILSEIGRVGKEFGATTGRRRKVNWLDLSRLIKSINLTGTNVVVISKCDVLEQVGEFNLFENGKLLSFISLSDQMEYIKTQILEFCPLVEEIKFSFSPLGFTSETSSYIP